MSWETFYFCGDGLYPNISMLVECREDWEKIVRAYKGDVERLRKMQPEMNHRGYGGPGKIGDDIFSGEPNLGDLLDGMDE